MKTSSTGFSAKRFASGAITDPLDIRDVWKNAYSGSTNMKIWAAKFTARHPNLVALEISNFKCGHDAPIYSVIEDIIENSGTPYFSFKDLDENKPTGSIKIRVETIDYFLKRYQENLLKKAEAAAELDRQLAEYERSLRMPLTQKSHAAGRYANSIPARSSRAGTCHGGRRRLDAPDDRYQESDVRDLSRSQLQRTLQGGVLH